ncbi:MAG: hypothetical protein N2260_02535 [Syntrophobacterales bacterium]|nr:hypothetical protein [Syntrophobacterales bacterium]
MPSTEKTLSIGLTCLVLFTGIFMAGCSSSPQDPLEKLKKELSPYSEYSVILTDMREEGLLFSNYYHIYRIIYLDRDPKEGEPILREKITSWYPVSKAFYEKYKPCLGMTIFAKEKDGTITDVPHPPAYQFIGDTRFGQWKTDEKGNQIWEWIGKYYVISSILDLLGDHRRISYEDWHNYRTSMQKRKPYFGPQDESKNPTFGTGGSWTQKKFPTFFERQQARMAAKKASFEQRVSQSMGKTKTSTFTSRTGGSSFGGRSGGK